MKRVLYITLIAIGLICLAAVGWTARLLARPTQEHTHRPAPRPVRRERPVRSETRAAVGSARFARPVVR